MAYATATELIERIAEQTVIDLTDDAGLGVINTDAVDRAFADADTEIDSYLAGRYPVPVSPAPVLLTRLSLDLATEGLYARRPHSDTPEAVVRAAKNARALLASIAANKAALPGVSEGLADGRLSGASFSADGRLFTRASQRGL